MSRIEILRLLVNERLTAAAEEIFGVFERTIEDYEGEINHQRTELDALKTAIRTDALTMQLFTCEEEVHPEQQERSPGLLQGLEQTEITEPTLHPVSVKCQHDGEKTRSSQLSHGSKMTSHPVQYEHDGENTLYSQLSQIQDPEPLQIKEEQEELIQTLEEDDGSRIPVKYEDGQQKSRPFQSLQTQRQKNREAYSLPSTSTEQMKTEPDGEDCGVSEPACNFDPAGDLELTTDGQAFFLDSSGAEIGTHQSGLKTQKRQRASNSRTLKRSVGLSHELKSSSHILSTHCCKVCGTSFLDKASLMLHIHTHPSDCGLCGKHLDPTESLKPHIKSHRTCNVCDKEFITKTGFVRHMRSHSGEKPFICSACGKGFECRSALQTHMRGHTGEKPFSCAVCGNWFSDKGSLNRHMKTHTGEKPFGCSVCGKSFSRKPYLQIHMRGHTGEKPFSCSVCGKWFSDKGSMKRHMRTHTGEKPFSCSVCGKGFSRKTDLQKHERSELDRNHLVAQFVEKHLI